MEMGASYRTIDFVVAMLIFFIGLAVMIGSYHLGIGWVKDSPGSGYFPFRIGAIISLASVGIAVQSLLNATSEARSPFVEWSRFRLVLAVLIPTTIYILGISYLGIYVSSFVFIAAFMHLGGKFRWLTTLAVSSGTVLILFWLFEIEFLVPLPKGPLEALLGY
jgi:hypothetical protein